MRLPETGICPVTPREFPEIAIGHMREHNDWHRGGVHTFHTVYENYERRNIGEIKLKHDAVH
ncbi:hypothetical protein W02_31200 [Nitrospira sp. KM1]|nr:hypothetical protein W02_31200 [Nitrospira sp. KM1]